MVLSSVCGTTFSNVIDVFLRVSVLCGRCGVMRLLDRRFAGEARGVGSCKILGKVHVAQMKLGGSFFSVSLTVLEENNDVSHDRVT